MDFLKEIIDYFIQRKKIWLIPILLVSALFAVLIVFTEGTALAPFIYTIF